MANFLINNLANLQTYYLGKADEAIKEIEELIKSPSLDPVSRAEFKIQLGDIYLIQNQIWDASLLYSQVEKDFKFETIGHEAKFRNAKLSYYAGDFKWAKTQADVLKGSTSKLIANDALDLSLIITDAIGVDTNSAPLAWFASADLLILQHKYTQALAQLDSINKLFATHTLGDDIFFKKAEIFTRLGRNEEAEKMYKDLLEYYPTELYGDDAQFKLAELYERKFKDIEKAKQAYQDVLTKYPGSVYVVEARKRYRALRGDNPNNG
jgi:tetratricopeptide (TPR) repeat protein